MFISPFPGLGRVHWLPQMQVEMLIHALASLVTSAVATVAPTFQVPPYSSIPGLQAGLSLRWLLLRCPGAGLDGPERSDTSQITTHSVGTPRPHPKSKQESNETHGLYLLQALSTAPYSESREPAS